MISRRQALVGLFCAPAIVRASSLMPVRSFGDAGLLMDSTEYLCRFDWRTGQWLLVAYNYTKQKAIAQRLSFAEWSGWDGPDLLPPDPIPSALVAERYPRLFARAA